MVEVGVAVTVVTVFNGQTSAIFRGTRNEPDAMREVGRPENLNKHITVLNLSHESPVLRSANGPLPRSLCPRDKLHFSSYGQPGAGQLSGATRAIIINQAHPLRRHRRIGRVARIFAPSPPRERVVAGECRLCNLSRTTFSSADAYHAVDSISQGNRSSRQSSLPLFARSLASVPLARKREY